MSHDAKGDQLNVNPQEVKEEIITKPTDVLRPKMAPIVIPETKVSDNIGRVDSAPRIQLEAGRTKAILAELEAEGLRDTRISAATHSKHEASDMSHEKYDRIAGDIIDSLRPRENGEVNTQKLRDTPSELIDSEEFQTALKRKVIRDLEAGIIEDITIIGDNFPLPDADEFLSSDEVKKAACRAYPILVAKGDYQNAISLAVDVNVPDDVILSPDIKVYTSTREAQAFAIDEFRDILKQPYVNTSKLKKVSKAFSLSDHVVSEIYREELISSLNDGRIFAAVRIRKLGSFSDDFVQSGTVQEAVRNAVLKEKTGSSIHSRLQITIDEFLLSEAFIKQIATEGFCIILRDGNLFTACDFKDRYSLPDEILITPEVQAAGKTAMVNLLTRNGEQSNYQDALRVREILSLPDDILSSPEVQEAGETAFINILANEEIYDRKYAFTLKAQLDLPDTIYKSPEVQAAGIKAFTYTLTDARWDFIHYREAFALKDRMKLPDSIRTLPEVQQAVKQIIIYRLENGILSRVHELQSDFFIPEDFFKSQEIEIAAKNGFIRALNSGSKKEIEEALAIKAKCSLTDEIFSDWQVQRVSRRMFLETLSVFPGRAIKIKDALQIPDEFLLTPDVQGIAIVHYSGLIKHFDIEGSNEIKEKFLLSDESIQRGIQRAYLDLLLNGQVIDIRNFRLHFSNTELEHHDSGRTAFIERLSRGDNKGAYFIIDELELDREEMDNYFIDQFTREVNNEHIDDKKKILMFSTYCKKFAKSERAETPAALMAWRQLQEWRKNPDHKDAKKEDVVLLLDKVQKEISEKEEKVSNSELDIPVGLGVSIGTELEIMLNGITRSGEVSKEEIIDYEKSKRKKNDPRMVTFIEEFMKDVEPRIEKAKNSYKKEVEIATMLGVGKGMDAVHEFANKATDNYSVLLWEMQELGRLGFIDFDPKLIQWIEQGMHLTISSEGYGLKHDNNAKLLQIAMMSTGWSANGIDAVGALEITDSVDDNSEKLYKIANGFSVMRFGLKDEVFQNQKSAHGVENRALSMNSFNDLARTLKSFHRLSIALKAYQNHKFQFEEPELQEYVNKAIDDGHGIYQIAENPVILKWLKENISSKMSNEELKLMLVWVAFRTATIKNFEKNQSTKNEYRLKNPLEEYDRRDFTRLGGELDEVFHEARDETGELTDDAFAPYHREAKEGSVPDTERKLVISTRGAIEKILRDRDTVEKNPDEEDIQDKPKKVSIKDMLRRFLRRSD